MFRCENCRHVFHDPITVTTETGPVSGCPWCGADDMIEIEECEQCGAYLEKGGLFASLCRDCLLEDLDYPTALSYLLARDHLRDFMIEICGASDESHIANKATKADLMKAYLIFENMDRDTGEEKLLGALRRYILDDPVCATDFALWLKEENQ